MDNSRTKTWNREKRYKKAPQAKILGEIIKKVVWKGIQKGIKRKRYKKATKKKAKKYLDQLASDTARGSHAFGAETLTQSI